MAPACHAIGCEPNAIGASHDPARYLGDDERSDAQGTGQRQTQRLQSHFQDVRQVPETRQDLILAVGAGTIIPWRCHDPPIVGPDVLPRSKR